MAGFKDQGGFGGQSMKPGMKPSLVMNADVLKPGSKAGMKLGMKQA